MMMSIHPQIKLTIINILILTLITKKCKIKTVTSKVKIALFTDTTPSLTYWENKSLLHLNITLAAVFSSPQIVMLY